MKLETTRDINSFLNIIQELRNETGRFTNYIPTWQVMNCKWIYRKAHNRNEAKSWIKIELGWDA